MLGGQGLERRGELRPQGLKIKHVASGVAESGQIKPQSREPCCSQLSGEQDGLTVGTHTVLQPPRDDDDPSLKSWTLRRRHDAPCG